MSITDFLKNCITCSDGRMLCWDFTTKQPMFVKLEKDAAQITDITEADLLALKKKIDAETAKTGAIPKSENA